MRMVAMVDTTTAASVTVEPTVTMTALDELDEVALVALGLADVEEAEQHQQRVHRPAQDQPRQRQAEDAEVGQALVGGEQRRQAEQQAAEHGEDPHRQHELGPGERADQNLPDRGLLGQLGQGPFTGGSAGSPAPRVADGDAPGRQLRIDGRRGRRGPAASSAGRPARRRPAGRRIAGGGGGTGSSRPALPGPAGPREQVPQVPGVAPADRHAPGRPPPGRSRRRAAPAAR